MTKMLTSPSQEGPYRISEGQAAPLGATVTDEGVNFSLYTCKAFFSVELLFSHPDDALPVRSSARPSVQTARTTIGTCWCMGQARACTTAIGCMATICPAKVCISTVKLLTGPLPGAF